MSDPTQDPPPGFDERIKLLQFVHRAYTDPDFQNYFKAQPELAMSLYKLTIPQKTAVYHSGVDPITMLNGQPIVSTWWKEYALFRADKGPFPDQTKYAGADRPSGELASLAGVTTLLIEELSNKELFEAAW